MSLVVHHAAGCPAGWMDRLRWVEVRFCIVPIASRSQEVGGNYGWSRSLDVGVRDSAWRCFVPAND